MDIPILFEDEKLLVINKPAGVIVNRAESVKTQTVQDWAESYLHIDTSVPIAWGDSFESRAGIAHRIDKETSGILLLGKDPASFAALQLQFKERLIKKTYLALVHGDMNTTEGEINAPVGRLPWNREHFGVVPGGKDALTAYRVISHHEFTTPEGQKEKMTLVAVFPHTGRTHQIRVHMKYINHPLVGDYLYAGRKTSREDRVWAPRVMLHAWKLSCSHPQTGNALDFESPMPDDMRSIISV